MPRIVGLIPAGGRATRISPLPCSKELLPIGLRPSADGRGVVPKVVSHYLVEQMRRAGASELFFIVRNGKWDIAEYYGDGSAFGVDIGYLVMGDPFGPPFTLAKAAPFIGDAIVLTGFPDILLQPADLFARTAARLLRGDADVVLGLVPASRDQGIDTTRREADGRIVELITKEESPQRTDDDAAWMVAAWTPRFTEFLVAQTRQLAVQARAALAAGGPMPEWPVGAVISAAIRAGMVVQSELIAEGRFLDVGTSAGLVAAAEFPGVWTGGA